jgi:hypothetical protein
MKTETRQFDLPGFPYRGTSSKADERRTAPSGGYVDFPLYRDPASQTERTLSVTIVDYRGPDWQEPLVSDPAGKNVYTVIENGWREYRYRLRPETPTGVRLVRGTYRVDCETAEGEQLPSILLTVSSDPRNLWTSPVKQAETRAI